MISHHDGIVYDEVERYRQLIEAVAELVVDKYDGSLKAEHGTGRNMAPFVERAEHNRHC